MPHGLLVPAASAHVDQAVRLCHSWGVMNKQPNPTGATPTRRPRPARALGMATAAAMLLSLAACAGVDPAEAPAAAAPPQLSAEELAALVEAGEVTFLDVRPPLEISEIGTVRGYVSIPIDELPDRLDELPKDRPIVAL